MADADKYAQWIVANQDKKGTPEFETVSKAYKAARQSTQDDSLWNEYKTFAGGQLESLQNIGANTVGRLTDALGIKYKGMPISEYNKQQRAKLYQEQGVNPESGTFQAGKTIGDIELTMPVSQGLAGAASKVPQLSKYAQALRSSGFDLGPAALKGGDLASKLGNILMKTGAGVTSNVAATQLTNPEEWKTAAAWGLLPAGLEAGKNVLKAGATKLMTSAVKPDIADFESGAAQKAVQSMLEEGVNPTLNRTIWGRGLDTVKSKIDDLNNQVKQMVAGSQGNVSKQDVLNALDAYAVKASKQLAPEADLEAIKTVRNQIIANKQMPTNYVPAQIAQELKQGTYKAVGERAYGQESTAAKEAQKVGAKALKEGIERAVPGVAPLNKKESELINMLDVVERKAYAALKNNPAGLATLAPNDLQAIAMMADRSAPFKALLGRILYRTGEGVKLPIGTAPAVLSTQEEQ